MEEQIREIVESTFHAWWKSENMSIQDAVRLLVSRLAALMEHGCDGCLHTRFNQPGECIRHRCSRHPMREDLYAPTEPKE